MDDSNLHLRRLIGRHLPGLDVRSIERLGEGLDNTAYLVNGELVVRQAKVPDSEAILREETVLDVVGRYATLPVPEVVFAEPDAGVLAYRMLPGRSLLGMQVENTDALATSLGAFLASIHRIPMAEAEDIVPRDDDPLQSWLDEANAGYREIASHLPASARQRIEVFLASPPPPEPARFAFCHNDFGAEHILVDPRTMRITGVVDWTDAAISDPMRDHALVFRDLGPGALSHALAAYGTALTADDHTHLRFYACCKLIEDLAYGIGTGASRYIDAALDHFDWTF